MKRLFIFFLFLGLPFNACADDKIFLYGDYYYGMSREDFLKTGAAQCDNYPDGFTVCNRQKVVFAAFEWTQFFEFDKKGLTCVAFGQPLSMAAINAAMTWFENENYMPVNAVAGKASMNFSLLYDKNTRPKFLEDIEHFNRNLPSADNFNAYLIKQSILDEYKTMNKLPEDAIIATLGGSKSQGVVFACFEPAKNFTLYPYK